MRTETGTGPLWLLIGLLCFLYLLGFRAGWRDGNLKGWQACSVYTEKWKRLAANNTVMCLRWLERRE